MTELNRARERVFRYRELCAKLNTMYARRDLLSRQEAELRQKREKEQRDVDKLEGNSLTAFFYTFTGQMDEKLRMERREAAEAALRHDMVKSELDSLLADIAGAEAQRGQLAGSEHEYLRMLENRADELKRADPVKGPRIMELEQEMAHYKNQSREISEAVSAGQSALSCADAVLTCLDNAEGFGVWDLMGGGLIADIAKHSNLDDAQHMLENLQRQLSRFKTELSDVDITADLRVDVEGFLRFADYFFDGLFADWAVMSRIKASQSSVQNCRMQLQSALYRLRQMQMDADNRLSELKTKRDALITEE